MGHPVAAGDPVVRPVAAHERASALDPRRKLQLALGVIWLLDAVLQFQPFMFGRGFVQMLVGGAHGNPAIAGRPVAWSAAFIGHHVTAPNAIFAAIQLLPGLGLARRPGVPASRRPARARRVRAPCPGRLVARREPRRPAGRTAVITDTSLNDHMATPEMPGVPSGYAL